MKAHFDLLALKISEITTRSYSTSFSMSVRFLPKDIRQSVYAVYGFVRFADEIVDSFHDYDKKVLLEEFKAETYRSIERGVSLNPILNSFQSVVNQFEIPPALIESFFRSMEMDLEHVSHEQQSFDDYIFGSAEAVGLICLTLFVRGDKARYVELEPSAKRLGAAFQKVNFLRDLRTDYETLGRVYFPNLVIQELNEGVKKQIETDIGKDFELAEEGIRKLPADVRLGVFLTFRYYTKLYQKIQKKSASQILQNRIRVPNSQKYYLLFTSYLREKFNRI